MSDICGFDTEFLHDERAINKRQVPLSVQFSYDNATLIVRNRQELEDNASQLPRYWFSFNLLAELGALQMLGYKRHSSKKMAEVKKSLPYRSGTREQKKELRERATGDFTVYTLGSQIRSTLYIKGERYKLYDVMGICRQLGMPSLYAVGRHLFQERLIPYPKLPDEVACLGCGKYPCDKDESRWRCEKYALHDAIIVDKLVTNLTKEFKCDFTRMAPMGGLAAAYLEFPKRNERTRAPSEPGSKRKKPLRPQIRKEERPVKRSIFAGRSECFMNGYVGHSFYNDVVSLYPTATLISDALSISGVEECGLEELEITRDISSRNYGWVTGMFKVKKDPWGMPVKEDNRNYYMNDALIKGTRHTMDIAAGNCTVVKAWRCLKPIFAEDKAVSKRYEAIYWKKNRKEYKSETEKQLYKGVLNAATGKLGQGASKRSFISTTSNFPAYSTCLAASHLIMSNIMAETHSTELYGMDTDSLMAAEDLTGEYGVYDGIPIRMDLKAQGKLVYIRAKMYSWLDDAERPCVHAWHFAASDFSKLMAQAANGLVDNISMKQQYRVTPRTRIGALDGVPIGMWFKVDKVVTHDQQIRLCLADTKRIRGEYNSLQLLEEKSHSWSKPHNALSLPTLLNNKAFFEAMRGGRLSKLDELKLEVLENKLGDPEGAQEGK